MENMIKRQLTRDELAALIARAFGEQVEITEVHELKDGWFNSAYDLTLNDGSRAVLKVAPHAGAGMMRYERNVMKTEVEVLRLLRGTGNIPVPEVYYYEVEEGGNECFLMEYLHGTPYNKIKEQLLPEERGQIEEELGRLSRYINEIQSDRFGYFALEEQQGSDWLTVFSDMVSGLLADAKDKDIELPASEEQIKSAIALRKSSLEEVTVPRLVHWDLWDGNVFVDSGRITGIIDCERALWGDPLMEYYFRTLAGDHSAFLKGYGKEAFTNLEKERLELYDLYLALILHIECTYRQYSDENHRRWASEHLQQCWESIAGTSSEK
ncbi:aminoglycoside phosphotransferase family protein [Paenibacillus vini]|uniref:phosphotransferase family protein n=1 Tax=Paenibacillus vini TaxID=1476024 RepID=UPI0025B6BA74|nr:aminoglycoside phosphotransferase family protein [Paenibacillus vini]MDN4070100.1 aminoglycoside phosphotransferase family protein [Paenibacillus vini]